MKKTCNGYLLEVFQENKKLIRLYIALALILSVFMYGNVIIQAHSTVEALGEAMTTTDVSEYGGNMAHQVTSLSTTMGISVDPSIVLSAVAVGSILNEKGITGNFLSDMDFGIFNNWGARAVIFIWTFVSITPGLLGMQIDELNTKYLGPLLILGCEAVYMAQNHAGLVANAADTSLLVTAGNGILMALMEFIKIIVMYVCYACVRMLIYALNALILILCQINPVLSELFKLLKIGVTIGYMALKKAPMWVFLILSMPLVLVGFLLLKQTIIICRYFKTIYIKPFIHKLFGIKNTKLIPSKMPKKLEKMISGTNARAVIPVFPLKPVPGHLEVIKRDLWWLVVNDYGRILYHVPMLGRIKAINLDMEPNLYGRTENASRYFFLRKPELIKGSFCEIFTLHDVNKGALNNMATRFAFSKEYKDYLEQLRVIGGFADYDVHKEMIKQRMKDGFNEKIQKLNPFQNKKLF